MKKHLFTATVFALLLSLETAWSIDKVIQELVEFNQWQAYSYSREQLIEKLDAALKVAGE